MSVTKRDPRWTRTVDKPKGFVQPLIAASLAALLVAACASGSVRSPSTNAAPAPQTGTLAQPSGNSAAVLRPEDRNLDCRRLTGRMQVRILQIRDRLGTEPNPAYAALRSFMRSFHGSAAQPANVDPATQQDVALLNAYNAELGRKNCPQFNLEDELRPKPVHETPRPVR